MIIIIIIIIIIIKIRPAAACQGLSQSAHAGAFLRQTPSCCWLRCSEQGPCRRLLATFGLQHTRSLKGTHIRCTAQISDTRAHTRVICVRSWWLRREFPCDRCDGCAAWCPQRLKHRAHEGVHGQSLPYFLRKSWRVLHFVDSVNGKLLCPLFVLLR